jgi:aspartate/methionine/tyrosine aminotransferase
VNPLAEELNRAIQENNPRALEMLSGLGKALFFPKGILSQSAEAKQKAHKFNATIGIALENGQAMHLPCIHKHLSSLKPGEAYPYAPASGRPDLREAWRKKLLDDNPKMRDKEFSNPLVISAITHGLSVVGDLFVGPDDVILLPDKFWGNYRLTYVVRLKAKIETFPLYDADSRFNTPAMEAAVQKHGKAKGKVILLLNFPNNPTGYSISAKEAEDISAAIKRCADAGINQVVVHDDAYFGLFYEDEVMKESLFGYTANLHERVLAVKLCGATKEEYVWGFRTGFITFGTKAKDPKAVFTALEKKTMGSIRGCISNSPHLSQTLVLKALQSPDFPAERRQKYDLMKARANKVKEVLSTPKYDGEWRYYPFNSGYFMCLELKNVDAEKLRVHLLDKYGVGTIAAGGRDLRVAFSCIEVQDVQTLFDIIQQGVQDLTGKPVMEEAK